MRRRARRAALKRSLILSLTLAFFVGPAAIDYTTNLTTARQHNGEPSPFSALLAGLCNRLCPVAYALDNEHEATRPPVRATARI